MSGRFMSEIGIILIRLEYTNVLITYDTLKNADFNYRRFKDICYQHNVIDVKFDDHRRTVSVGKHILKFTGDMSYAQMRAYNGQVLHDICF